MKKTIFILLLILLFSCNNENILIKNKLYLDKEFLIENINYEIKLNSQDTNNFLLCAIYSNDNESIKCNYFKFKLKNNLLYSKLNFNKNAYFVNIYVVNKGKIVKNIDPISFYIMDKDSNLKPKSYINLINNKISIKHGRNLISDYRNKFPHNLDIFPLKWKFEASHKVHSRDTLIKNINFIENNFVASSRKYFVLFIANKLLSNDSVANLYLDSLSKVECEYFNDPNLYPIFNKLLNIGYNSINNNTKILNDIYIMNPLSLFTLRHINSPTYLTKDKSIISIIDTVLKVNSSFYVPTLISKFRFLNYMRSDTNSKALYKINLDTLLYKISNIYYNISSNNSYNYLSIYKYNLFEILPESFFKNYEFGYHFLNNDYNKAISTVLNSIKKENKLNKRILIDKYIKIGDVYFYNLNNLANAKNYYFKALEINNQNKTVLNKLKLIFEKYNISELTFDEWVQINLEKIDISKNKKNNLPKIMFLGKSVKNLYNKEKNTLLIFTNYSCSVCKYIYQELNYNKNFYNSNYDIIYLSEEKQNKLNILNSKYKTNMREISNASEIFNFFQIGGVPVVIIIDTNGHQIFKEEGANENWTLTNIYNQKPS